MAGPQVELLIRRPGHPERRVALEPGAYTLGRAEDSDIVLPDSGVSRRHARVVVGNEVIVEDTGSGNGTWMGTRKLSRYVASDGDELGIEPFTLVIRIAGSDPATEEGDAGATLVMPVPAAAPPAAPLAARLEVISAHELGERSRSLDASATHTLGRSEKCTITLPEPAASRVHAEVLREERGWVVRDRNSANGTWVNGKRVREAVLAEHDVIRIGTVELRFSARSQRSGDHTEPGFAPPPSRAQETVADFVALAPALPGPAPRPAPASAAAPAAPPLPVPPPAPVRPAPAPAAPPLPVPLPAPVRPAPAPSAPLPVPAPPAPAPAAPTPPAPLPRPSPFAPPAPPAPPVAPPPAPPPPAPRPSPFASAALAPHPVTPPSSRGPTPIPTAPPFAHGPAHAGPQARSTPPDAAPRAAAPVPPPFPVTPETTDISPAPPLAPAPAARPVASAPPPAYAPAPSVAPLGGYAAPPPAPAHLPAQAPSPRGAHGQPDRWSGSPDEEIAIDPRSAREGRRLRSSGQGGAQGGFLSRRINQVTLGFAALVVLMLGWKALRDPGDAPAVAAASAPREEPGPAVSAAPTAGAGVDPSAAGVGTVPLTPAQVETLGAHMATGMAAFKERRHVEARRAFEQALEVDASNADARRMAYLVSEALLLDAMRDVLVARNASDAQRRAAKDGALAAVEAFGGGDADPAREALAKAAALNPGDPDLAAATGRLEQKVSASAVAAGARREEKRRASLAELLAAGQRDFDRGEYAKAIGTWNRLLEQDSTRSTQEYYQAEEQIRLAKDRAKAETKRAYADGITAFRAGEYMTARARLEEVVAVDPFNETASQKLRECQTRLREQASAVFKEARVLEEEVRQPDKAIAAYQRVITLVRDPGDSLQQKAQTRLDALLR